MADIEYPQRWLREAQAITSPEGWRKERTNELLKCQKGLEDTTPPEVVPELKTVSISGIPTTTTLAVDAPTIFEFSYSFIDADYTPVSVECVATTDKSATLETEKLEDNKFKVTITDGVQDEKISVKVTIDTVSSVSRSTTLTQ